MSPATDRTVTITQEGRQGRVIYREPSGTLAFHWEFGGGDVLAILQVEGPAPWDAAWLRGRHEAVLRFVAAEVIRQRAPRSRAHLDVAAGGITLVQAATAD